MLSKNRLYTIIGIGVLAVLSVAIVLMAITVTRSNLTTRSSTTEEMETVCHPVSTKTLKDALGAGDQGKLCDNKNVLLDVAFQGSELKCGKHSTKQITATVPKIILPNADKNARYTLVMVDPDAPGHSLDDLKFWLHWAKTDIRGKDFKNGTIGGVELISYAGPSPPKGSGNHRYMILVFESTKQGKADLQSDDDRSQFALHDFVKKNGLCTIVGLFEFVVPAEK